MTGPPIYEDTVRNLRYRPGARHELRADSCPDHPRRSRVDQDDLTADDYLAVNTSKTDPEGRDDDLGAAEQDSRYIPTSVVDENGFPL